MRYRTCGMAALILAAVLGLNVVTAEAQTPQEVLNYYLSNLQKNPSDSALREKIIKLVQTMKPAPAISEEARRYFVKASTIQKEAKEAGSYELAVTAYNQALLVAPWWPEAYYNLSLALETLGRFDEAVGALKLYILTGPGAAEARDAQDRVYEIEARKEMARAEEAARQKAEEEERKAREPHFDGRWDPVEASWCPQLVIGENQPGVYGVYTNVTDYRHNSSPVTNIRTNGRTISFRWEYRWGQPFQNFDFDLTLSEDGGSLTGVSVCTDAETGQRSTPYPITFRRK